MLSVVIDAAGLVWWRLACWRSSVFFIDVALASNAARRPGPIILAAFLLNLGLFSFQVISAHKEFAVTDGEVGESSSRLPDMLVAFGDLAVIVTVVILLVILLN